MDLKGTKTEQNLMTAFAGESQARNKYTYFASVARKEGYEQIAAIFEQTANNEKEHAKLWFKALGGLGDTAAEKIAETRDNNNIFSIQELREKAGISKSIIELLRRNGVLGGLSETNQFSLF